MSNTEPPTPAPPPSTTPPPCTTPAPAPEQPRRSARASNAPDRLQLGWTPGKKSYADVIRVHHKDPVGGGDINESKEVFRASYDDETNIRFNERSRLLSAGSASVGSSRSYFTSSACKPRHTRLRILSTQSGLLLSQLEVNNLYI